MSSFISSNYPDPGPMLSTSFFNKSTTVWMKKSRCDLWLFCSQRQTKIYNFLNVVTLSSELWSAQRRKSLERTVSTFIKAMVWGLFRCFPFLLCSPARFTLWSLKYCENFIDIGVAISGTVRSFKRRTGTRLADCSANAHTHRNCGRVSVPHTGFVNMWKCRCTYGKKTLVFHKYWAANCCC